MQFSLLPIHSLRISAAEAIVLRRTKCMTDCKAISALARMIGMPHTNWRGELRRLERGFLKRHRNTVLSSEAATSRRRCARDVRAPECPDCATSLPEFKGETPQSFRHIADQQGAAGPPIQAQAMQLHPCAEVRGEISLQPLDQHMEGPVPG